MGVPDKVYPISKRDAPDFQKGRTRFPKGMHPISRKGTPFKEITLYPAR
jgi:hypothetical protein